MGPPDFGDVSSPERIFWGTPPKKPKEKIIKNIPIKPWIKYKRRIPRTRRIPPKKMCELCSERPATAYGLCTRCGKKPKRLNLKKCELCLKNNATPYGLCTSCDKNL